jgi:hypothetical protein
MQLKMQDVLGFVTFYETVKNQKLTMKTAYKLAQLARAVESESTFYRESLSKIIDQYGQKNELGEPIHTEDGTGVKLITGKEEECYKAILELQNVDIELPDIQFDIEEFANIELTVTEMGAILPFLKD